MGGVVVYLYLSDTFGLRKYSAHFSLYSCRVNFKSKLVLQNLSYFSVELKIYLSSKIIYKNSFFYMFIDYSWTFFRVVITDNPLRLVLVYFIVNE